MKKALIIALILLVIGAILVGIGWALLQKYPIEKGIVTEDLAGDGKRYSTSEVGDWVAANI